MQPIGFDLFDLVSVMRPVCTKRPIIAVGEAIAEVFCSLFPHAFHPLCSISYFSPFHFCSCEGFHLNVLSSKETGSGSGITRSCQSLRSQFDGQVIFFFH